MGLPTGTFSSPYSGRLQMTLTAEFDSDRIKDAGFPSRNADEDEDIALDGYIGPSGNRTRTATINKFAQTAVAWCDYPGGNANWPCGVTEVGYKSGSGLVAWSMRNIRLSFKLHKK